MINTKIQALIESELPRIPQHEHIPKERFHAYLSKILAINPNANLMFYVDRLKGIGGSEVAAILNHYYKASTDTTINSNVDFKDAKDISLEKLLLVAPFSTPQAERGTRIEGMVRDIFERRYSLQGARDHIAMEAGKSHATNPFMKGNPDDIFSTTKRVLVDYKSTNSFGDAIPYSHCAQLNHYQENLRSKGLQADVCVIANLIAPEPVLLNMVAIYEARETNPRDYEYFVNSIADGRFDFIKMIVNPVQTTPEFGALISNVITRYMHEFPLAGKTINADQDETVLVGENLDEAVEIETTLFRILSAENAINTLKQAVVIKAESLCEKVSGSFEWPSNYPVNINQGKSLNTKAAIEALELSGFDINKLYSVSDEIDKDLIVSKFIEQGGLITTADHKKTLDKEKLASALNSVGLDQKIFIEDNSLKIGFSRKGMHQNHIYSSQIEAQNQIVDLLSTLDLSDQSKNSTPSFN